MEFDDDHDDEEDDDCDGGADREHAASHLYCIIKKREMKKWREWESERERERETIVLINSSWLHFSEEHNDKTKRIPLVYSSPTES